MCRSQVEFEISDPTPQKSPQTYAQPLFPILPGYYIKIPFMSLEV